MFKISGHSLTPCSQNIYSNCELYFAYLSVLNTPADLLFDISVIFKCSLNIPSIFYQSTGPNYSEIHMLSRVYEIFPFVTDRLLLTVNKVDMKDVDAVENLA
jgi:hypothetical protein